ncbi:hypothetical protein [Streptomyces sp. NBC_01451]|uniref:hypothetical protein n=1 Tax=Streptomyces sp. NBC_01451 TaxID=2903872 RepID=UPI002E31C39E|nr:hypothetical protein [Streptomyces sp. NBC_01451]
MDNDQPFSASEQLADLQARLEASMRAFELTDNQASTSSDEWTQHELVYRRPSSDPAVFDAYLEALGRITGPSPSDPADRYAYLEALERFAGPSPRNPPARDTYLEALKRITGPSGLGDPALLEALQQGTDEPSESARRAVLNILALGQLRLGTTANEADPEDPDVTDVDFVTVSRISRLAQVKTDWSDQELQVHFANLLRSQPLGHEELEVVAPAAEETIEHTLARLFLLLGPPPEPTELDYTPAGSGGGGAQQ